MDGLLISDDQLKLQDVRRYLFDIEPRPLRISPETLQRVQDSEARFTKLLEKRIPIYGVTTGFGDSCFRVIPPERSAALQSNLIQYLSCGTGEYLPPLASKAAMVFRLKSLSRGYSGVSRDLIERLKLHIENNWIAAIPRKGSLGASGDLVPLAYIARTLQGEGFIHCDDSAAGDGMTATSGGIRAAADALEEAGLKPYILKPKEGIALVNGTSAMAGLALLNHQKARFLTMLASLSSAWLCLALRGRTEAFGELVNERAKHHPGQARAARRIRDLLAAEGYAPKAGQDIAVATDHTEELIQDRYSLRCAPQILGPVLETLELVERWLEVEVNGVSDNPLIDDDGRLGMGGNFYGGYLSQGMDYLKISLAQIADLCDRQLTLLIDDKSNRGLPPNLANWPGLGPAERHLHHGLKGLHQAVNALTSEIMPKALANSIFSRSSESHNQDKVSLGMSAATQCHDMLEDLFHVQAMHLICLAQALDLRGTHLMGDTSLYIYKLVRSVVPFVEADRALDDCVDALSEELKDLALYFERRIPAV